MPRFIARANAARAANLAMALRAKSFVESQIAKHEAPMMAEPGAAPAMLEAWAERALRDGCGDCSAQSALAFVHLRDAWKARPLDWMRAGDLACGFVVIGRSTATVATSVRSWNPEAVICDPWRGAACPADQARWLMGAAIGLIHRLG
jgi:hypothetical protein